MSIYDILSNPSDGELGSELELEKMDMLGYSNPDMMTSDFFDSVLSLGNVQGTDDFVNNLDDDVNMLSETSSHLDEVFSPRSTSSESDKSNISINTESNDECIPVISGLDESLLMSFLESGNQIENKYVNIINKEPPKPTKIVIQNPNNKKIIVTKPLIHSSKYQPKKTISKNKQQILKVQTIDANGRPVLVPLNVKNIKILHSTDAKDAFRVTSSVGATTRCANFEVSDLSSQEGEDTEVVSSTEGQYPALNLTGEEKRLLSKEGIQLPTHYPLTKNEERELKRIRRKIRNKISAQDSRKRKKEYVDGLEERVKRSSEEKKFLLQRIKQLERQNNKLMSHFAKLQALIFKSSTSKATPSTCVMIVLLSALLVSLPNIRMPQRQLNEVEQGARRALLSSQLDEDIHMDEFLVFKDDQDLASDVDVDNITEKEFSKMLEATEKSWSEGEGIFEQIMNSLDGWLGKDSGGGAARKATFVEPDIDEGPPPKKACYGTNFDAGPEALESIRAATFSTPVIKDSKEK